MAYKDFIDKFVKDRDAALLSFDAAKFRKFYNKYRALGVYTMELPDDRVVEVSMRQAILGMSNPPKEAVEEAKKWLRDHGLNDDPWKE